jgi:hypothetical protein
MDEVKKIRLKHFVKHIILAFLIILVLIFGNCRYSETGMLMASEACGRDHFFKQMIIKALLPDISSIVEGKTKFLLIEALFQMPFLFSIILFIYATTLIFKKKNDENHFLQIKRLLDISFWMSFIIFFIIFILSLMTSYT